MCDKQSLPTDLLVSNIPEVWQSLRLHPRGKRTHRLNWFRKSQKKTKLLKVQVPGQLTGPVQPRPPIGQHSTPAPPYVKPLQLQIWHSTITSQSERMCPSSIPNSKPLRVCD